MKVCVARGGEMAGGASEPVAGDLRGVCRKAFRRACGRAGVSPRHVRRVAATGFGAVHVNGAGACLPVSLCAARGAHALAPAVRTVVDAGGLFLTVTSLDETGQAVDSITNDPCAAASGKFLEMVAGALEVPFEEVSARVQDSASPYRISSTCAVFAESEVISRVNTGADPADILAGVVGSIAGRAATLLEKVQAGEPMVLVGGLARIDAFVRIFEGLTGRQAPPLSPYPGLVPAYGAALAAAGLTGRRWFFLRPHR